MKTRALAIALLGWFFMFKVPHPELPGITLTVLVGFFKDQRSCGEEYRKLADGLPDLPGITVTECENAEEI